MPYPCDDADTEMSEEEREFLRDCEEGYITACEVAGLQ